MVSPATVQAKPKADGDARPSLIIPFPRAAREHVEPFLDRTLTALTASQQNIGPEDVPAYGFLRHVLLYVEATGGTGAAAVYKEDAPFSVIADMFLSDVNGAPIVGPISGYDLFLICKYGGYAFEGNPKASDTYVAPTTAGNFSFLLRIPVEVNARDGLGALANLNSSQTYKIKLTIAAKGDVYSTDPTAQPQVRIRGFLEAWTQPLGTDARGQAQATTPPAHGTTQYWTKSPKTLGSGTQVVGLPKLGNLIRNLILVFRNTSDGLRSSTNFPADVKFSVDGRILLNFPKTLIRHYMGERYGYAAADLDTGVYVLDMTHDFDGHPGGEMRDLYLPTTQASRVEIEGSFGAAGTLTILTNDIAPAADLSV